ncbi:MAG: hypothetical protein JSS83_08295 [Cyanobacteria bacterium SZAS LIN-3]|nr:hypothetical protein [Cyanobacteria bacterium SZAS LIN-3]MBS2008831.1 hypothetical protein [Cyanobacteria bacterium SZAS TMP-1]
MSKHNSQNQDCPDGVCEISFKPSRIARQTLQNLKAMAGGLMEKVKETLTADNHDAVTEETTEEKAQLARLQAGTKQDQPATGTESHISIHKADILDRFIQTSWNPDSSMDEDSHIGAVRPVHVRPRAPENQLKPGRYNNPWRYDNRH